MAIPVWLAKSIVPAASSLAGGVIGSIGQHSANQTNRDIAREQNVHNAKMQREQNMWNLAQWHRQNEYNTPSAQRKRFEEAGINPALALGNISAGTAEALSSAPAQPAAGATVQNPFTSIENGISQAAGNLLQQYQLQMMSKRTDADVKKVESETSRNVIENKYLDEQKRKELANAEADKRLKDLQGDKLVLEADQLQKLTPLELAERQKRIDLLITQKEVQDTTAKLNMRQLKLTYVQEKQMRAQVGVLWQQVELLKSQRGLTDEQAKTVYQQGLTQVAQRVHLTAQTKQIHTLLIPQLNQMEAQITQIKAQTENTRAQTAHIKRSTEFIDTQEACMITNTAVNAVTSVIGALKPGK